MNDRKEPGINPLLIVAAVGAGLTFIVIGWIVFARSGDERISSNGFSDGGVPGGASVFSSERRKQTGLSFVSLSVGAPPSSVQLDSSSGTPSGTAALSGAAPSVAPPPSPSVVAAPRPTVDKADKAEAGKLGVPTSEAGLSRLTEQRGPFSKLFNAVLGHPKVVKFLLNNKIVVDALFSREAGKRSCDSSSALTSYLANGSDPKGVSEEVPVLKALMQHPDSAAEAVNSEFGRRVMACPSIAQLKQNPSGLAQAITANPGLLSVVTDPAAMTAVSVNPQAASLFTAGEAALGLGGGSSSAP